MTDYDYRFGNKLKACYVDGIAAAQYNYEGMGKRCNKFVGMAVTCCRCNLSWNMVAEYMDDARDFSLIALAVFRKIFNPVK